MPTARQDSNEYYRKRRRKLPQAEKDKLNASSRVRHAKWYAENKERVATTTKAWRLANKEWVSFTQRLKTYGLTLDQFHAMYERQDFSCAICGKEDVKLVIDHCHGSGRVRGLLCTRCNVGLGIFGESVESINRSIAYLEKSA